MSDFEERKTGGGSGGEPADGGGPIEEETSETLPVEAPATEPAPLGQGVAAGGPSVPADLDDAGLGNPGLGDTGLDDGLDDADLDAADLDDFDDDDFDDDLGDFDDDLDGGLDALESELIAAEETSWRWTGILTTIGASLVAVAAIQTMGNLIEGLSTGTGERIRTEQFATVTDDLSHRIGYAFLQTAVPTLILLLIGVALLAVPWALGQERSRGQHTVATVAFWVAAVTGVVLGIASTLVVRATLHNYSVKGFRVPRWQRWNSTNFLLVTLGMAAVATYGAVSGILEQRRRR